MLLSSKLISSYSLKMKMLLITFQCTKKKYRTAHLAQSRSILYM